MPLPARPIWIAPALTLALLASPAAAGPISWSYQAALGGNGSLPNTGSWVEVPEPAGSFTAKGDGSVDAFRAIRVNAIFSAPTDSPTTGGSRFISDDYDLTVRITDTASGETGQVHLSGGVGADWEYRIVDDAGNGLWRSVHELQEFGAGPNVRQSLALGGNRYDAWGDGIGEAGFVAVAVTAGVNTPEPASLALAAAGLASARLVRLGRRIAGLNPAR